MGNNAVLTVKRQVLYELFFKTCAKYGRDQFLDLEQEPEPKSEPKFFQSRNQNRSKSLAFHNTGIWYRYLLVGIVTGTSSTKSTVFTVQMLSNGGVYSTPSVPCTGCIYKFRACIQDRFVLLKLYKKLNHFGSFRFLIHCAEP
jgi:hypothetical protein